MAILHIQSVNKRDQLITLDNGLVLSITVERIFFVNIYLGEDIVGTLKFEALSSLNNLEIKPMFKLQSESFSHPEVQLDAASLRLAGMELYKTYTNGKIINVH